MSEYGHGGDDNSRGTYNYRGTNRGLSYRGNNYGDHRSSSYQNRGGGGLASGVPYRGTGRPYSRSASRSRSRESDRNRDRRSRSRSRDRRSPPPSRSMTRPSDESRGQGYSSGSGERQAQCLARHGDNQQSTADESVFKIRKVMRQRDMDSYDDDVAYTRIARRVSPPPGPDIKPSSRHHGTWNQEPSAATASFFGNASSGIWGLAGPIKQEAMPSTSEDVAAMWGPAGPIKQEAMPSTSEDVAAMWSTQYHSSKPQQSGTPLSATDKEERESSPPRGFVFPGLGDIEDEEKFLYGDDTEEDTSKKTTPAVTNRSRDEPESTPNSFPGG